MSDKVEEYYYEEIKKILLSAYNKNVFSASSISFLRLFKASSIRGTVNCGKLAEGNAKQIDSSSLFDLASLTKPLVTLPCILSLIDGGKIGWLEGMDSLLERSVPKELKSVTLFNLLNHSSGLPAHRIYSDKLIKLEEKKRKEWLVKKILEEKKTYNTGEESLYSDLGYILLGFVVEIKTGMNLDQYWYEKIAERLKIKEQCHFPSPASTVDSKKYVATGYCRWSGTLLQGRVQDENCRALNGVAGHAGLFGTSEAVIEICRSFVELYEGHQTCLPISSRTFFKACQRAGHKEWTAGFTTPSVSGSSSGSYFSRHSIGHLGFTGTSFWIDLERRIIVVLLTNRVIKGDSLQGIRVLRPQIHNLVMGHLLGLKDTPGTAGSGG